MKILITGSSGFLGKTIYDYFNKIDSEILTIGRNQTNKLICDLTNKIPAIKNNNFDIAIHCAGKLYSKKNSQFENEVILKVNLEGTKNLLKGLESVTLLRHFVFISSVAVYGLEYGINIDEETELNAQDPYGLSKIKAEQLVLEWCNKHNVVCTILRLPLLIGKNPQGNLGSMIKAIKKGYYFNIGGGVVQKSMVLTEDVANFIPIIAPIGGIYNLTDGLHPSYKKLSETLTRKKIVNLPLGLAFFIGKIGDLFGSNSIINTHKVKKLTYNLTFNDFKAREKGWSSTSVLKYCQHFDL